MTNDLTGYYIYLVRNMTGDIRVYNEYMREERETKIRLANDEDIKKHDRWLMRYGFDYSDISPVDGSILYSRRGFTETRYADSIEESFEIIARFVNDERGNVIQVSYVYMFDKDEIKIIAIYDSEIQSWKYVNGTTIKFIRK